MLGLRLARTLQRRSYGGPKAMEGAQMSRSGHRTYGIALAIVAALVAAVGLAVAGTANAKGDDDVLVRGTCTGRSAVKMKASPENGRLEVELEVDENRVGRRWRVTLSKPTKVVFRGVRRTTGPSGSFELRRVVANNAGADRITGQARELRTGERCRVTLTI